MSEAAIREQIKTILSGVAGIGKVHDYQRWAATDEAFIQLFKATVGGVDQIRGWEVYRKTPFGEEDNQVGTHTYVIGGYMSQQDATATEKIFNALIETIRAAFRNNPTLNGAATGCTYLKGDVLDRRSYGQYLCHHVELSMIIYEEV